MRITDMPARFPVPFAAGAGSAFINNIPEASQPDGFASLTDGFPPLTFEARVAGGKGPYGQDMNGILKQISAWSQWAAAGNPAVYDATFSSQISGYPRCSLLGSNTGPGRLWVSIADNNTNNPDSSPGNWVNIPNYVSPEMYGAIPDNGTTDCTAAINACFTSGARYIVIQGHGTYVITDELVFVNDDTVVVMAAGSTIKQNTPNKNIFDMTSVDNCHIAGNGATLYGNGTTYGGNVAAATFTGSISGTTLTVASSPAPTGTIGTGTTVLSGGGTIAGTKILSQSGGTPGGAGTYVLDTAQTVASSSMTSGIWGINGPWTGTSGHEDMAVQMRGCTRCSVKDLYIKNCALAGVAVIGGAVLGVLDCLVEGTTNYTIPIQAQGNFQCGVYISTDGTYGQADQLIVRAQVSNVAQGLLKEVQTSASAATGSSTIILDAYNIDGQHAVYWEGGAASFILAAYNVPDSGLKIQSGDAQNDIRGIIGSVTGINVGGNLVELGAFEAAGSIQDFDIRAVGYLCGTGASVNGKVGPGTLNVTSEGGTQTIFIEGDSPSDLTVYARGKNMSGDGILVTATNATGIKLINPILRNCNTGGSSDGSGIRVSSASANVDIYSPDVTDANTKMNYGLINEVVGSLVRVFTDATLTGAAQYAVRATGLITEWPVATTLQGSVGQIATVENISSSGPMKVGVTSTGSTNTQIWGLNLADLSAYQVDAMIVGKLSDSSQRGMWHQATLCYRDAGNATIQGSPQDLFTPVLSGSFAGTVVWIASGNQLNLYVNSSGGGTAEWEATIMVTPLT